MSVNDFGRNVSLIIGTNAFVKSTNDLYVKFRVEYSEGTEPPEAEVEIYNLNKTSRSQIEESVDLGLKAILQAGYRNGNPDSVVFGGMVKSVSHKFKNVDVCTTVVISAGMVKFKEANVNISIPTPTTSSAVINQALLQMKLPSNLSTMAIEEKKFKQYSYSGSATSLLDTVTKDSGLNWKIDQDRVVFYSTNNNANFLQISPLTNLIGSPEIIIEKEEATTVDAKASITKTLGGGKLITKKKYNIQTRLSPNSKIGDIVNVSSKVFGENKTFKILSLVHMGDNRDGKFMTEHVVQELANGTQK